MGETRNRKIPRLIPEADITRLPLGPTEGFVLSRIDGATSLDEIADMTGLGSDHVSQIVVQLIEEDVAEWVEPIHPRTARHSSMPRITPPRGTLRTKPPPPHITRTLYDPQELEEPDVDLDVDRRREILDTFYRLDELSYYELLGVAEASDKKEIRDAYFRLSKKFHPDTLYGKRLGSYKAKMEVVFNHLTQAYEILGKKRARAEYDAYLKLRKRTLSAQKTLEEGRREAERIEREVARVAERILVAPEPKAPEPRPAGPPRAPPPEPAPSRPMTAEAKQRSRQLLAKKLAAATGRGVPGSSKPPAGTRPASPPPGPREPAEVDRDTLLRGLASSLKQVASVTGGVDRTERHLADARRAEADGNLVAAANSVRLALALAPDRSDLTSEYDRLSRLVAVSLAETYEKQAQYEERAGRWAEAAISWSKVCEGRPDDGSAHRRAAVALLEAGGDLAKAKVYAQRAVDLMPEDAKARRALGRVFSAAGMTLNAKRELEKAAKLDPSDEMVKNLLRELGKKK